MKAKLEAEWAKFKFDLDSWKSVLSSSVKDKPNEGKTTAATGKEVTVQRSTTPLEWSLQRVMKLKSEYGYCYPLIVEQKLHSRHQ